MGYRHDESDVGVMDTYRWITDSKVGEKYTNQKLNRAEGYY